jgi:cytoskeletal protein RodZ
MTSFGELSKKTREELGIKLWKIAAEIDIGTYILDKNVGNERTELK